MSGQGKSGKAVTCRGHVVAISLNSAVTSHVSEQVRDRWFLHTPGQPRCVHAGASTVAR